MVMVNGIVSIAGQLPGHPLLARALFALNLVAYAVLCALNLLRALRHRQRFFGDLVDAMRAASALEPQVTPGLPSVNVPPLAIP